MDGAFLCRLPDEDASRLRLEVGLRLESAELEAVQAAGGRAEAMFVGLRYLSVRPRSRRETERRLRRDRIDPAAIQHALERLAALGYLDDAQFAASFARDRIRLRPCGTRRMQSDLLARGVSREDADRGIREAMAEEGATEEALLAARCDGPGTAADRGGPVEGASAAVRLPGPARVRRESHSRLDRGQLAG